MLPKISILSVFYLLLNFALSKLYRVLKPTQSKNSNNTAYKQSTFKYKDEASRTWFYFNSCLIFWNYSWTRSKSCSCSREQTNGWCFRKLFPGRFTYSCVEWLAITEKATTRTEWGKTAKKQGFQVSTSRTQRESVRSRQVQNQPLKKNL